MNTTNDIRGKVKELVELNKPNKCANLLTSACSSLSEERDFASLVKDYIGNPSKLCQWVSNWCSSKRPDERRLACHLVADLYEQCKQKVLSILLELGNDSDWKVREEAAWAFSRVLKSDFDKICELYKQWASSKSSKVRRAIVVAVIRVGKLRRDKFAEGLFELLELLMADRDEYVRKNLGPYALGDGLLKYYPERGFQFLWKCMKRNDEQIRWNIAMSLSSTAGAEHADRAVKILSELALDDRRYVWRATASAMKELVRRKPSTALPVLKDWQKDQRRNHVAQIVARYVDINESSDE